MNQPSADKAAIVLLGLAAAGWYAAGRAAADALAGNLRAPGRRAAASAIPVFCCVLVAIWAAQPEVAVGVLFASSVAALTLVLGVSVIVAPHDYSLVGRRAWVFVLPAALIALLIGFSGSFRWIHVAFLLIQGLAVLLLWLEPAAEASNHAQPSDCPIAARPGLRFGNVVVLGVAIVAAVLAGWMGVAAARGISNNLQLPGCGLVAALMLAPALVLPMLGTCATLSAAGRLDEAIGSSVAFVLINLCVLLPLTATLWLSQSAWRTPITQWLEAPSQVGQSSNPATAPATTRAATEPSESRESPPARLAYPMSVWRVDTVVLIVASLLLLPVTFGRWRLDRSEGLALVIAYALYMVLTTIAAR